MKLSELLTRSNIRFNPDILIDHSINKISIHSKTIEKNDIFVAIRGSTHDGHEFIEEAIERGCTTIVYEDPYYSLQAFEGVNSIYVSDTKKTLALLSRWFYKDPGQDLKILGVTGTNGKTTITTIIHQLYRLLKESSTLIGTNGIYLNDDYFPTVNTTPNALILQQQFRKSVDLGIKQAILEVSSHAIKEQRVSQIDFHAMIYTNFSQDHLDYHITVDDYFYNKALSFAYLGNQYNEKYALFNGDDEYVKRFLEVSQVKNYTYGLKEPNDFRAVNVVCSLEEMAFDFYVFGENVGRFKTTKLFGFYNIYNLLAVLSYFYLEGYPLDIIRSLVPKIKQVRGRFERVETDYPLHVFIDFAHTPKGVYKLLQEVKLITSQPVITVIGCGGNRDRTKRPLIGKITTQLSDFTIFTDDNPRHEKSEQILDEIVKGAVNNHFLTIPDRREAIEFAIRFAKKGDLVLILGKGHETVQEIGGVTYPFDDYEEAKRAIEQRFMEE